MPRTRCFSTVSRLVTLLAATGLVLAARADDGPSEKLKKLLGDKIVAILSGPTKVEAFRIESERNAKKGDKQISGYKITASASVKGKEFAAKVAKVMLDEKTHLGDAARCFQPGVAFRIWRGKDAVDVIICFKCTNLGINLKDDPPGPGEADPHGFGPETEPLQRLVKEAFAADREDEDSTRKDDE